MITNISRVILIQCKINAGVIFPRIYRAKSQEPQIWVNSIISPIGVNGANYSFANTEAVTFFHCLWACIRLNLQRHLAASLDNYLELEEKHVKLEKK